AQETILLACWVLGPLLFFTINKSKLPQYVLPLMPPFAIGAARVLTAQATELGGGLTAGRRTYLIIATLFGVALASLTLWLPAPISLTPAERAAIPPTALSLGVALLISAALIWYAGRPLRLRPALGMMGYTIVVLTIPFVSHRLRVAIGEDRSAKTLAQVIESSGRGSTAVLGISAFPPSLPFYLRRPGPVRGHGAGGGVGGGGARGGGGGGGGGGATLRHPESIPRMAAALKHRGPDGECIVGHERARIGARRLAIMDLTTGDQPFQSPDGKIWMVCNGEIYNAPELRREASTWGYPFRSHGDIETIVPFYQRFGADAVARLE